MTAEEMFFVEADHPKHGGERWAVMLHCPFGMAPQRLYWTDARDVADAFCDAWRNMVLACAMPRPDVVCQELAS